jgi:L-amino acid N-acyltransferase YncA
MGSGHHRPMDGLTFDPMTEAAWPAARAIYEEDIAGGDATFETAAPGWAAWDHGHLADHRLVATRGGRVVGWAALSPVSDRCAYAGVFPENTASLAMHRRCGFRTVGVRERPGKLDGRWRDVVLLERRSPLVD